MLLWTFRSDTNQGEYVRILKLIVWKFGVIYPYRLLPLVLSGFVQNLCAHTSSSPGHIHAVYLSPEEVAQGARLIVHVNVLNVSTSILNNWVYTDTECRVIETWKGESPGEIITIRQLGGATEELITKAGPNPNFHVAEEWIVGLAQPPHGWWTVYGLKQGAFRISGALAERDFSGVIFLKQPPNSVVGKIEKMPLSELRDRMLAGANTSTHDAIQRTADGSSALRQSRSPTIKKSERSQRRPLMSETDSQVEYGKLSSEDSITPRLWYIVLIIAAGFVAWGIIKSRKNENP
jgi:hypothetical protein